MRFIDKSAVVCPAGWQEKSVEALNAVTNDGDEVDAHSSVWRDYKDPLWRASSKKCWYCEVEQERSDNAVDHFRPKSHYWWLAFSADNFRYSCTYCNSRRKNPDTSETEGKGDKFPLLDETRRAQCAAEEDNEVPMLLDPCRPADPGLLDFEDDGKPVPTHDDEGTRRERAEISIVLYHLDHPDIVEKRRLLANKLEEKIAEADRIYPRCETGDPDIDASFDSILKDFARALSDKAELSSFSRRMISGSRDKDWVEQLLETA